MNNEEKVLVGVLDRWKAEVDAHQPERVATLFTEDAIFQGLHPYSVGRAGVAAYYDSQPLGMVAEYRLLETRRPAEGVILGYAYVEFLFTDREPTRVNLTVVLRHDEDDWRVAHYQVSRATGQ
jgi:uncharacterized protein (TIGR02246 family)